VNRTAPQKQLPSYDFFSSAITFLLDIRTARLVAGKQSSSVDFPFKGLKPPALAGQLYLG
jgi:hypothetical protein